MLLVGWRGGCGGDRKVQKQSGIEMSSEYVSHDGKQNSFKSSNENSQKGSDGGIDASRAV